MIFPIMCKKHAKKDWQIEIKNFGVCSECGKKGNVYSKPISDKAVFLSYFYNSEKDEFFIAKTQESHDSKSLDEGWKHISAIEYDMMMCDRGINPFTLKPLKE